LSEEWAVCIRVLAKNRKLGMIEEVCQIHTKVNALRFMYAELFHKAQVKIADSGTRKDISAKIPQSSFGGTERHDRSKNGGIKKEVTGHRLPIR
jgi:hypothetical protein